MYSILTLNILDAHVDVVIELGLRRLALAPFDLEIVAGPERIIGYGRPVCNPNVYRITSEYLDTVSVFNLSNSLRS